MKNPKKRKKSKNNRIFKLILLLFIGYFVITMYQQKCEMELLRQQEAEYMEKIEQRKKEIAALEEQLKQSNDDEYIEKIARQQLKMVGSDEIIIIDIGKE
ncbi:MAG: septum formation initiator family protein [Clostridiales bacterium]|nr:septum formation initiator family protein [Clostridiales bacterium]